MGTVHKIIHEHLKFSKLSACWIPRQLSAFTCKEGSNLQRIKATFWQRRPGHLFLIKLLPAMKHGSIISPRIKTCIKAVETHGFTTYQNQTIASICKVMVLNFGDKNGSMSTCYLMESILTVRTTTKFFKLCTILSRKLAWCNHWRRSVSAGQCKPTYSSLLDMHTTRSWLRAIATFPLQSVPCFPLFSPIQALEVFLGGQHSNSNDEMKQSVVSWFWHNDKSSYTAGIQALVECWDKFTNVVKVSSRNKSIFTIINVSYIY